MTNTSDHTLGDTVIVAARGPWFGRAGTITATRHLQHPGLGACHQIDGDRYWWHADELAPPPNPTAQTPTGTHQIIRHARDHGWMVHVASHTPHRLALISGPGHDGTYVRVWATLLAARCWVWTVETFSGHGEPLHLEPHMGGQEQLLQLITGHQAAEAER